MLPVSFMLLLVLLKSVSDIQTEPNIANTAYGTGLPESCTNPDYPVVPEFSPVNIDIGDVTRCVRRKQSQSK